jgi:hypothetical protein
MPVDPCQPSLGAVTTVARAWRRGLGNSCLTRALRVACLAPLLGTASIITGAAAATLPPPTISDLHVTNFDPFLSPPGATFDATSGTFMPPAAGFDSQGFDFINSFTNNEFTSSVDGYDLFERQRDSLESNNFSAVREMLHMMLLDPYEFERERETSHYFVAIAQSIDAGRPVPLMLVEALSLGQVFDSHQVLATGYFYRGGPHGQLVVQVYDPNFPGRFMYLNTHNTYGNQSLYPSEVETYDPAGAEYSGVHFYGFFTTTYTFVAPPWALETPTRNLLGDPGGDWTDSAWNLTASSNGAPPGTNEAPRAEPGAAPGSESVIAPPGWSPAGNFTVVQYGAVPKRLLAPEPGLAFLSAAYGAGTEGGQNHFAGGPGNTSSSASQVIYLGNEPTLDAAVDSGREIATLSGDLGGERQPTRGDGGHRELPGCQWLNARELLDWPGHCRQP